MLETLNGSVNWISGEPAIGLMKIRMVKKIMIMVVKMIINNDHDNHVFEYLTITDHEFSDDFYDNLTAGSELDFYVDLGRLG